jgi:hypothetical protein
VIERNLIAVATLALRVAGLVGLFAFLPIPAYGQISDTTPPQLVGLSIAPSSVDVTASAQTVTVTVTATDDLSGVNSVSAQFNGPPGSPAALTFSALLISGNPLNRVFQLSFQVPQFVASGVWNLAVFQLRDQVGNTVNLSTANLQTLGFQTGLTVTSVPDSNPPQIVSIGVTPVLDVSTGAQNLTLSLDLTDDVSGLVFQGFTQSVFFSSPSGKQQRIFFPRDFLLTTGTALNGTWQAVQSIPQFSEAGLWKIDSLSVSDLAGNRTVRTRANLQAMGLVTDFTVVSSPQDTTPPSITSLAFSPAVIDTSAGPQLVTITLNGTDDLSGMEFGATGNTPQTLVRFVSPSGNQSRNNTFSLSLIGGTPLNGIWQGTINFPRFSEGGTWKASLQRVKDHVLNMTSPTTADLAALGFPTDLVIFEPSGVSDGTAGSAGATITDTVFGANASVTFPPGALPASTTVAIDVLSTSLGLPTPAGFSGGTLFMNVALTPTPPMPFAAPGLSLVLPLSVFKTPGSAVTLFRLDPGTGLLVPAPGVGGGTVVGTVGATGLSASFTGVARLSTVAGFFPTSVLGDVNGDGLVDCADMSIVKASFGRRTGMAGFDGRADLNRNGVVDVNDLAVVSRQLPPGTVCQ